MRGVDVRDVLSAEQVRRLLNLSSRKDAQMVLSQHSVWPGLTVEEVLKNADMAAAFITTSV